MVLKVLYVQYLLVLQNKDVPLFFFPDKHGYFYTIISSKYLPKVMTFMARERSLEFYVKEGSNCVACAHVTRGLSK